jgi:hypothetical protein
LCNTASHEQDNPQVSQHPIAVKLLSALRTNG